jgi:DNA-binding NtrC family response regulator
LTSRAGRLEQAQGGTLFLDEIGNLPLALQPKLLRVLQERCFVRVGGRETIRLDARIVSATNVNLGQSIREGRFREDLYYRLNEVRLLLPTLRERVGDVSVLAKHFIELHATRFSKPIPSISLPALQALEAHTWPGNVRQLENVMKAAVVMADEIIEAEHIRNALYDPSFAALEEDVEAESVPPVSKDKDDGTSVRIDVDYNAPQIDLHDVCSKAERAVLAVLVDRRLPLAHLAKLLNIDPKTLRVKLRKYGLIEA